MAGPCTWKFSTGLWVDLFFVKLNCCVVVFSVIYSLYLFLFGFLPLFYLCLCFCANQIAPTICHLGTIFKNVHTITDAVFATTKNMPQMMFLRILTLRTCFPSMFDVSTMLKLCWNFFWGFWSRQLQTLLKFLSKSNGKEYQ